MWVRFPPDQQKFFGSSVVERLIVNQRVAGSNPARRAKKVGILFLNRICQFDVFCSKWECGGMGRHEGLSTLYPKGCTGSNPVFLTNRRNDDFYDWVIAITRNYMV